MAYLKELTLTYKRKRVDDDLLNKPVKTAKQVYKLFKEMENEAREKLVVLHLNPQLEILSYEVAALWAWNSAILDIAWIYRGILLSWASSVVVVHNHPLWNSKPSKLDLKSYNALVAWGEPYAIKVLDFIIIWEDWYFSFDENAMI